MNKRVFNLLILFIATILLQSCAMFVFNPKAKCGRAGKYPKFSKEDTLRGKNTTERSCYDVQYYELTFEPGPETKRVKGNSAIHFLVTKPSKIIQIDLAPELKIERITERGNELVYNRVHRAVYITFDHELKPGEKRIVEVSYSGKPHIAKRPPWEGGLVWKKDKNKKPWLGVACEDDGGSIWWPLKDQILDEPDSVGVNVVTPKGLTGVSNGRLIGRELKGEKEVFKWRTSYPVNTYNITFYIGDFEKITLPYTREDSTYELEFYVLPYSKEKAKKHFEQTIGMLHFFEKAFGEYPWWKDGYKLVESPYEGMEHQTAIAYGNGYNNNLPYNFDYIILHESAHEWWGNSLTAPDMAELWLHEGFATYSEAMYVEEVFGYESYLRYLLMYRLSIKNKRPIIGPYDVYYSNYKDGDIYTKGAWFLHSLRFAVQHDSLFRDILKTFAVQYRQQTVSTADFIKLVNDKTGKDFTWIFNQYLYQRQPPKLVYSYKQNWDDVTLNYRWENVVEGFDLPVKIKIDNRLETIYPTKETQIYKFKATFFSFPYTPFYFGTEKKKKLK